MSCEQLSSTAVSRWPDAVLTVVCMSEMATLRMPECGKSVIMLTFQEDLYEVQASLDLFDYGQACIVWACPVLTVKTVMTITIFKVLIVLS